MKDKIKNVLIAIIFIGCAIVAVVFSFDWFNVLQDGQANALLKNVIVRGATVVATIVAMGALGYLSRYRINGKSFFKNLLWCLPCILVAAANFPFTALIFKTAVILRWDLLFLFILKCLFIGIFEESVFRGILQPCILKKFANRKHGALISVAVCSAIFALWHLLNLFDGANVGATLLQVGYSFLIGAMLSAVFIKTKSLIPCIAIHAVFDFGGLIVTDLGQGAFQDLYFWVFTAVFGLICFVHVLYFLLNINAENCEKPNKI